jgi:glycosyltransferase involved in cell wall biosynthesis
MPELVEGNGVLCDSHTPEEISRKIIHLLNSPELIKKFSLAALEKSKFYDIKTTTNTLEKLYKSAI